MSQDKDFQIHFFTKNLFLKRFPEKLSGDTIFKIIMGLIASTIFIILGLMFLKLFQGAWLSIKTYGIRFLFGTKWEPYPPNPNEPPIFSALPLIWGTLITSAIAILLSVPISIGAALSISEFTPKRFSFIVSFMVELLAAIPSVIYGLWGIFILIPFLKKHIYPQLQTMLGFLPLFQGRIHGFSVLTASIVLAIMITPIITAVIRDALTLVPRSLREAMIALGATEWETSMFTLSYIRSSILGAIILGLGRAFGETMAVTMLIGNSFNMFRSLFEPGYTMASIIANEFTEASSPPVYLSALIEVGLLLFIIAIIINALARLIIWHSTRHLRETGGV